MAHRPALGSVSQPDGEEVLTTQRASQGQATDCHLESRGEIKLLQEDGAGAQRPGSGKGQSLSLPQWKKPNLPPSPAPPAVPTSVAQLLANPAGHLQVGLTALYPVLRGPLLSAAGLGRELVHPVHPVGAEALPLGVLPAGATLLQSQGQGPLACLLSRS